MELLLADVAKPLQLVPVEFWIASGVVAMLLTKGEGSTRGAGGETVTAGVATTCAHPQAKVDRAAGGYPTDAAGSAAAVEQIAVAAEDAAVATAVPRGAESTLCFRRQLVNPTVRCAELIGWLSLA